VLPQGFATDPKKFTADPIVVSIGEFTNVPVPHARQSGAPQSGGCWATTLKAVKTAKTKGHTIRSKGPIMQSD
jgi:hypothetical protein